MKRMLRMSGVVVALLAGAGAILSVVAPGAMAQVRIVRIELVKNVDEPGRAPYEVYVEFTQDGCSIGGCSNFYFDIEGLVLFDLPPVPAGKRLIIRHVSGRLPGSSELLAHVGFQSQREFFFRFVKWSFFGPFYPGAGQGFNSEAYLTYAPGEQPHVHLVVPDQNAGIGFLQISGYFIDATN